MGQHRSQFDDADALGKKTWEERLGMCSECRYVLATDT